MKKLLCLVLSLLLCCLTACAEETAADTLSLDEVETLLERYHQRAMEAQPLNDPKNDLSEEGYRFVYDFATLYADQPIMSQDTMVCTVVLTNAEEEGPRGVSVDNNINTVKDAFYSENPTWQGSYTAATLYCLNLLPSRAQWAQVHRDGQRVQTIQYAVHEQDASGSEAYSNAGVIFTVTENLVTAIRIYGGGSRIAAEEVRRVLGEVGMVSTLNAYDQKPFSYDGAELAKFDVEDLYFAGLDFLSCTPGSVMAALGQPLEDARVEDGDGGYIRTLTYEAAEFVFTTAKGGVETIYMVDITADTLEGPRATRVGDSFASVLNRFRNGEGEYQDTVELLYGSLDGSEYGVAEYGANMSLRYGLTLEDGTKVTLQLPFSMMALSEVLVYIED